MILYAYTFAAGFAVGIGVGIFHVGHYLAIKNRKEESRHD